MSRTREPGCAALRRWAAIEAAVLAGLQGIAGAHRVLIARPRAYACSLDLDRTLRDAEPQAPRWDYVLVEHGGAAVACEVHPARASEIEAMIAKKRWAQQRLDQHYRVAVQAWHWLRPPGSRQQFTPRAPAARLLAQNGIAFPSARLP